MKKKDCINCKYLYGSKTRPYCDWYDEPIKNIIDCIERKNNENKIKQTKV